MRYDRALSGRWEIWLNEDTVLPAPPGFGASRLFDRPRTTRRRYFIQSLNGWTRSGKTSRWSATGECSALGLRAWTNSVVLSGSPDRASIG